MVDLGRRLSTPVSSPIFPGQKLPDASTFTRRITALRWAQRSFAGTRRRFIPSDHLKEQARTQRGRRVVVNAAKEGFPTVVAHRFTPFSPPHQRSARATRARGEHDDGGAPGFHLRDGEGSRQLSFLLQGVPRIEPTPARVLAVIERSAADGCRAGDREAAFGFFSIPGHPPRAFSPWESAQPVAAGTAGSAPIALVRGPSCAAHCADAIQLRRWYRRHADARHRTARMPRRAPTRARRTTSVRSPPHIPSSP